MRPETAPVVHIEDESGRLRALSPAGFRRRLGVGWAAGLRAPARLPADWRAACARFEAELARALGPRRLGACRRALAEGRRAPTFLARVSPEVGWGLFARRALRPGEIVGEYAGVLARGWVPGAAGSPGFNPYLLRYPFDCAYAIDARGRGAATRFVNHSARGANLRRLHVPLGGLVRVLFVAARRIPAGRQLLLDYGAAYWGGRLPAEL